MGHIFTREAFRPSGYFSAIVAGHRFGSGTLGYEPALQAAHRSLAKGEES